MNWQDLPRSVSTLYRAQLLIILKYVQPTTNLHFSEYGFSKNNARKCLREFVLDDLVEENFQLYKLTQKGTLVVDELLKDSQLVDWYQSTTNFAIGDRPIVHRLE